MARMSNKLTGRDFSPGSSMSAAASSIQHTVEQSTLISGDTREVDHGLSVKLQVQKLIMQAKSHENLCQNYVGYVSDSTLSSIIHDPCKGVSMLSSYMQNFSKGITEFVS